MQILSIFSQTKQKHVRDGAHDVPNNFQAGTCVWKKSRNHQEAELWHAGFIDTLKEPGRYRVLLL